MVKKKMVRKLVNVILMLAVMVGICFPNLALAVGGIIPQSTDTGEIHITNINGENAKVSLYQIVKAEYGNNGGLLRYSLVDTIHDEDLKQINIEEPTTNQINKAAQHLTELKEISTSETVSNQEFSKAGLAAGAYIAIITSEDYVYNPMYLAVGYDENNKLTVKELDAQSNYLYGDRGVAKAKKPGVVKQITDGTVLDGEKNTVGVGDIVDYKVTPTIPSYPKNAINKTFFISDTMDSGLEFLPSLKVTVGEEKVTVAVADSDTEIQINNQTVAKVKKVGNGFNLNFIYDKVINENGSVKEITVEYSARITENAVVGSTGNKNTVEFIYANDPNKGATHDSTDKPQDGAEGNKKTTDEKIVYTYQIAFHKIGEGQDNEALAGAIFGVYTDEQCEHKIDQIVTNAEGYGVSNKVSKGKYWLKEIQAPKGYTLNTNIYSVEATWTSATTTATTTVDTSVYTTTESESTDKKQVGWIKAGKFYAMDEFEQATESILPAYLKDGGSTTTTTQVTKENPSEGHGTTLISESIPNTKTSKLPSTGGMGTYAFTIFGVAAIALAGNLYMKKKKRNKNLKA
ncbi:LPXTG-motif cell wall anchor domain-containing protein/fimbrial isopeptide formation D2 domain-containing protein [Granulicatella balaenopterae]|uniref:LPXTG-motif cell wall anchor domain-containing protein/fimbrial isopeptide formation D2 domain-containing protein n=1 Tax=Granulicatella balaenopterae TaxID=137733 RepID=A0A1H9IA91_9LACT|nr:isopeptide-forming domain-containing fimbrial protein [Granulicatella balaenopterae]SEQ71489.1 LPXTG-motif cell wall anchor domain-containing protein/fimbrial isopeptide formation D2 domain-containing protein [Granulicatella balaenopterae]